MAKLRNKATGQIIEVPEAKVADYGVEPKRLPKVDASVPYEPTGFQKYGSFIEKNLPTIGAVGLPLAITALSGGTAAPVTIPAILAAMSVAGAGAASGYGTQQAIRQLRGNDVVSQSQNPLEGIKDYYGGMATEFGGGAAGELTGLGVSKLAGKILGPILSRIGIGSPSATRSAIGDEANKIYQNWGPQVKAMTGDTVDVTKLVDYLKTSSQSLLDDPLSTPAGKFVSKKILPSLTKSAKTATTGLTDVGEESFKITPENARSTMSLLNKIKNYSPATGQEKITGDLATNISQRSAADLNKLFKEELKKRGATDILKEYEKYGQAKSLENSLVRPFDSGLGSLPTVLGALGFLSGNPLVGVGTTAGANLFSMPYTKLLGRQLLGKGVGSTEIPFEILINSLINAQNSSRE